MNTPLPRAEWWRWPLFPFATIFGALAAAGLMYLLQLLGVKMTAAEAGWYALYIMPALVAGTFGYVYARIAVAQAPKEEFVASVVMITLLFIVSSLAVAFMWLKGRYSASVEIGATVDVAATLLGSIVGLSHS